MAEVECITLDEDEDYDQLRAGRIARHPQMVERYYKMQSGFLLSTLIYLQVRCPMCVDPGLLPHETDMAKHRREV